MSSTFQWFALGLPHISRYDDQQIGRKRRPLVTLSGGIYDEHDFRREAEPTVRHRLPARTRSSHVSRSDRRASIPINGREIAEHRFWVHATGAQFFFYKGQVGPDKGWINHHFVF